jgi:hypothetical protein
MKISLLGKKPKLTPKWHGLAKITELNDTNVHVFLSNGKTKILNVIPIKNDLNFKSEPKFTGPITRVMRKLMAQQKATEMAINVLYDLSNTHCSMCEWEQDCLDNPLLFDPTFAR